MYQCSNKRRNENKRNYVGPILKREEKFLHDFIGRKFSSGEKKVFDKKNSILMAT